MTPPKNGTNRTLDILNSITEQDFLDPGAIQSLRENGLRIERVAIGLIRPYAAQPRRVLPEVIHQAFHRHELTPVQALKQYIEKVRIVAREKGRPFENLMDMLVFEQEDESPLELTPMESDLRDLTNLALTLRNDGQVNPLTIVDATEGVVPNYMIETGERRYWANYINMEFIPNYQGDGSVPCIILPPHQASVFRQAKENTARAGLNAIGMARQAALLLLDVHDIHPPDTPVSHDFYRQALDLDLRGKREYTADILAAMGGINKGYFSYIKSLLQLSDDAIELADRYNISEKHLRYIVQHLPQDAHAEVVRQIIDYNLTSKQVKDLIEEEWKDKDDDDEDSSAIPRSFIQLARLSNMQPQENSNQLLADALLKQAGNPHLAIARINMLRQLLDETEKRLLDT
ncbi:MAG: ParB/RepB/Spo0J family partition protein [Anaerolineae bacterium]|nr:ParB/RepB/Spo0J family partition protein [Anaerolineae bacterium]